MKKVKIMLLSLLVLAVAGGAMAFNVRFNQQFCTTVAIQDSDTQQYTCPEPPNACKLTQAAQISTNLTIIPICTTITSGIVGFECLGVNSCRIPTRIVADH
jgi:flagellar basal body-associated protein FliL